MIRRIPSMCGAGGRRLRTAPGRTSSRHRVVSVLVLAALALAGQAGCLSDPRLARGRLAEQRGHYTKAYRIYCEAAARRPSNRAVRAALARVSPLAAQVWMNRGEQFELGKAYGAAWRCYVSALLIRPDDTRALAGVRRLERNHTDQVADVRQAWLRRGTRALRISAAELDAISPGESPRVTDAGLSPSDQRRRPSGDRAPDAMTAEAPALSDPESDSRQSGDERAAEPAVAAAPLPVAPVPGEDPAPAAGRRAGLNNAAAGGPSPAAGSGYITTVVVSRDDKRFGKMAVLVDDIRVRVGDTDPGPDADMGIYLGRRRVRKVKNWREGEAVPVRGRSGRQYELVIISIYDETESVRVGIRYLQSKPTENGARHSAR